MSATYNTMSGSDWIGESRHAFCVHAALDFEAKSREALERGDAAAAERYKSWGQGFLFETETLLTGQPKKVVSDDEAVQRRAADDEAKQAEQDAEHLAALKRRLGITPRTNASAYHPYRGGLPTLGKDR
ncbi:hypothetical protein ACIQNU_04370 [Streptomyces sp. NPDC091292]|uniref:hypothetical protein n=1 Tax=Streptomyces sp. NPDC091292 TaxID=3365991 RepID=UPI0037FE5DEF